MAKIKHLIFDMGNVLMRYDPEVPLREYVTSEEARDLIRKELFQGPEWVERDRGRFPSRICMSAWQKEFRSNTMRS